MQMEMQFITYIRETFPKEYRLISRHAGGIAVSSFIMQYKRRPALYNCRIYIRER
jgi:hypothetical protein